jgi:hypothetical protein
MALPREVKLPPHDPGQFWKLFDNETDRAAAVLGGSYLEAVLEQVIRSWMPPDHDNVVNGFFDHHGFLGTIGATKNMAFALGLVDGKEREDIQHIANIRNFFAHHVLDANTFDHEDVRKELRRISFFPFPPEWGGAQNTQSRIEKWEKATPRQFYLSAIELLVTRMRSMRVGPAPVNYEHFRNTLEIAIITRASAEYTHYTLNDWYALEDEDRKLPEVWKDLA